MNRLFEIYIYIFYINEYWIIAKDSRLKLCNYLKEVLIVLYEINQQKIEVYLYLLWKKMKKDWMSRFWENLLKVYLYFMNSRLKLLLTIIITEIIILLLKTEKYPDFEKDIYINNNKFYY